MITTHEWGTKGAWKHVLFQIASFRFCNKSPNAGCSPQQHAPLERCTICDSDGLASPVNAVFLTPVVDTPYGPSDVAAPATPGVTRLKGTVFCAWLVVRLLPVNFARKGGLLSEVCCCRVMLHEDGSGFIRVQSRQ